MKHVTKEVTGCINCPFYTYDGDSWGYNHKCNIKEEYMEGDPTSVSYTPPWCPLKTETITVVLKDN